MVRQIKLFGGWKAALANFVMRIIFYLQQNCRKLNLTQSVRQI